MKLSGIGLDIVEIDRFKVFSKNKKNRFLTNNFSNKELKYCFSFKNYTAHLAGTFAAKEAIFKSLNKNMLISKIEIRREKNGKPMAWIKNRQQKSIFLSISHTNKLACAVAIKNA